LSIVFKIFRKVFYNNKNLSLVFYTWQT